MDDYDITPLTRIESFQIWGSLIFALAGFIGVVFGSGYWFGSQERPCTPPEEIHQ